MFLSFGIYCFFFDGIHLCLQKIGQFVLLILGGEAAVFFFALVRTNFFLHCLGSSEQSKFCFLFLRKGDNFETTENGIMDFQFGMEGV